MKKGLILLLMIGMCFGMNTAKAGGAGGFGIKAGMNLTTIGLQNETFSESKDRFRIGGTAGLGYEFATEGFFAFELELLYSLKGQKQIVDLGALGELTSKDFIHYVNLPASFKFYIGDVFNIHVGGYAGLAVAGKNKLIATNSMGDEVSENSVDIFDVKDLDGDNFVNRLDGGLLFGAEFVSEKGMGVGARGYIGLADISNDDHMLGNGAARTGEISIYAIFRFGNN